MLISAVIALAVVGGAVWFARRTLPTPRRRWLRILVGVATAVVAAIAFLPTWVLAMGPMRSGTFTCVVCGATVECESYAGIPLANRDPSAWDLELTQPYHDWFERSIDVEHDHDWRMTGCQRIGMGTVACTMVRTPATLLFRSLPVLPDQELARAMALRLVAATPAERDVLTRPLQEWSEDAGPFRPVAEGARPSAAEFAGEHRLWLERHAEWR